MDKDEIQECVVHYPHAYDPECESCKVEMNDRTRYLEEVSAKATNAGQSLQGFGVQVPAGVIQETRLEALLEILLMPRARVEYETVVGERLLGIMLEQNAILTRQQLMGTPKRLVPVKGNGGLTGL